MSDVPTKPINEKKEEPKKDAEKSDTPKPEETKKEPPSVPVEIKGNAALIDRAVSTLEPRYTLRVLRTLAALRKRLNTNALSDAISAIYPTSMYGVYSYTARLTSRLSQILPPSKHCFSGCQLSKSMPRWMLTRLRLQSLAQLGTQILSLCPKSKSTFGYSSFTTSWPTKLHMLKHLSSHKKLSRRCNS